MRILFISAFYPPQVIGGWEQLVADLNVGLQRRGHETLVLTSRHGVTPDAGTVPGVARLLHLESDLHYYRPLAHILSHRRKMRENLRQTQRIITEFAPDVIFIHSMWNLSRRIARCAESSRPGRVVYYIANDWPCAPDLHTTYWRDPARRWPQRWLKRVVAPLPLALAARERRATPLRFERVLCVSEAIRCLLAAEAGIAHTQMEVVYNGIDLREFVPSERPTPPPGRIALLFAGSLVPHKGAHTAIEALALLDQRGLLGQTTLTIVGSGHPDYEARLRRLVAAHGLDGAVSFRGRLPRDQMAALMAHFDVLVFPSIWEEPLARVVQEAMAVGLVVVGTTTGGSAEILVEGETGLTFPPGDGAALAARLAELQAAPEQGRRLAARARATVVQRFSFNRMLDEVETALAAAAAIPLAVPGSESLW